MHGKLSAGLWIPCTVPVQNCLQKSARSGLGMCVRMIGGWEVAMTLVLKGTVPDLADATVTVSCSDEMLKSETQWQANRRPNLKHLL